MLIAVFGKPDFDRGCGNLAGTETRIIVTWQLEIYPQGTRKCPIWQTRKCPIWQTRKRPIWQTRKRPIWQTRKRPIWQTRKCPIWQTRNLDLSYAKTALVALNPGQGEAMYRHEVPTSRAVLNLENKHADAERLSSPRG
jgi:hypothetical protein